MSLKRFLWTAIFFVPSKDVVKTAEETDHAWLEVDVTSLEAYGPDLLKTGVIVEMKNAALAAGYITVVPSSPLSHGAGMGAMMMNGNLYRRG